MSANQIAQTREVNARALMDGHADLRTYPHQHLGVMADLNAMMPLQTAILICAEILGQHGWELVSVARPTQSASHLPGDYS